MYTAFFHGYPSLVTRSPTKIKFKILRNLKYFLQMRMTKAVVF